ncbi:MAG: hypothetical protein PHT77_01920 [Bacteroidales bacterium]|nr:hypothetical protein [Bacteroidales bacterium]MDD3960602.1 hypothetical protein [Bacteroidales bacterium]MDY0284840.1 hypothetical protein [Bacteroidales bacterium]HPE86842.1 hypothetical protein [Bacteroidales bacterium]
MTANIFVSLLQYVWEVVQMTFSFLVVSLGPLLILATVMNFLAGRVERSSYRLMGPKVYLRLFGGLGTATHELGHAFFCKVFGHRITEMKLFTPDPASGTLGYVNHSYNPKSKYQQIGNFFIGIGPVITGSLLIYILAAILIGVQPPSSYLPDSITASGNGIIQILADALKTSGYAAIGAFRDIFSGENWSSVWFYVFLYLVFAIGSSVTLSPADMKGASKGFLYLVIFLLVFNALTLWMGRFMNEVSIFFARITGFMNAYILLAAFLNLIFWGLMAGLSKVLRRP